MISVGTVGIKKGYLKQRKVKKELKSFKNRIEKKWTYCPSPVPTVVDRLLRSSSLVFRNNSRRC